MGKPRVARQFAAVKESFLFFFDSPLQLQLSCSPLFSFPPICSSSTPATLPPYVPPFFHPARGYLPCPTLCDPHKYLPPPSIGAFDGTSGYIVHWCVHWSYLRRTSGVQWSSIGAFGIPPLIEDPISRRCQILLNPQPLQGHRHKTDVKILITI
jgi:hypothetical protein